MRWSSLEKEVASTTPAFSDLTDLGRRLTTGLVFGYHPCRKQPKHVLKVLNLPGERGSVEEGPTASMSFHAHQSVKFE